MPVQASKRPGLKQEGNKPRLTGVKAAGGILAGFSISLKAVLLYSFASQSQLVVVLA